MLFNIIIIAILLQGDLAQQEKRAVFLTVHDLGCNRKCLHYIWIGE